MIGKYCYEMDKRMVVQRTYRKYGGGKVSGEIA